MPIKLGHGVVDDDFWEEWNSECKRLGVVMKCESEEKGTKNLRSKSKPASESDEGGVQSDVPDRRRTRSAARSKDSEDDEPCPLPDRKRSKRSDKSDNALRERGRKFPTARERLAWYRESESFALELFSATFKLDDVDESGQDELNRDARAVS